MVVAAQRDGGQAQFIEAPVAPATDDPLGATMGWALERLGQRLSVADLARHAHLSTRQFTRRFQAATGATPAQWLIDARVRASLELLEGSEAGVEEIGRLVGIPAPAGFRRHFTRVMGVAPSAYRRAFRSTAREAQEAPLRRGA
jgi:AraC family transcriptional activator FtrA